MRRGERPEVFANPLSAYQRALAGIEARKNFVRFLVYPDSFEVYLKAREISEVRMLPAGWDLTTTEEWKSWHLVKGISVHVTKPAPAKPPVAEPASRPNVLD